MSKTVMIFGMGRLGEWVLEFLARSEGVDRLVIADIREDYGVCRTNVAAFGAAQQGYSKKFEFHKVDVYDIDRTADLLRSINPDVIHTALAIQSGWVLRLGILNLAEDVRERILANFSVMGVSIWLPWHLNLVSKLMQAVKKSGINTHVINGSYPDVSNHVLWKRGLGPTVGHGNFDLIAGEIRKRVSDEENVPLHEVTIYLVGSHALTAAGARAGVPFSAKIFIGDKDVTNKFDVYSLIDNQVARSKVFLESVMYSYVAASAVKNILAILNDTNELTHAPSPNGLPGGYPVRLSAKGAEVVLPQELSLEQAVRINNEGLKWDGIEEIKADGTVVYTDEAYNNAKEVFGYDCKELLFDELDQRAEELSALYKEFMKGYGASV